MRKLGIAFLVAGSMSAMSSAQQQPPTASTTTITSTDIAVEAAPPGWKQEPTGFAGVPFGATPEEAKAHLSMTCPAFNASDAKLTCTNKAYRVTDDFTVDAKFFFVKGENHHEFNGVELSCSNRTFSTLKALLFSKYGSPTVTGSGAKVGDVLWMGAAARNTNNYAWIGANVNMTIVEPPQPLARSVVRIERLTAAQKKAKDNL